jgi:Holliday junction resolvase-like predicted endonuclease
MSTRVGSKAETFAAEYLKSHDYTIIERNWRTPVCEIDIIAKKDGIIYFAEVKFRSRDSQGGGLEYITPAKVKQMAFAARCWIEDAKYQGDYCLSGIEVAANYEVTEFIECIDSLA